MLRLAGRSLALVVFDLELRSLTLDENFLVDFFAFVDDYVFSVDFVLWTTPTRRWTSTELFPGGLPDGLPWWRKASPSAKG